MFHIIDEYGIEFPRWRGGAKYMLTSPPGILSGGADKVHSLSVGAPVAQRRKRVAAVAHDLAQVRGGAAGPTVFVVARFGDQRIETFDLALEFVLCPAHRIRSHVDSLAYTSRGFTVTT